MFLQSYNPDLKKKDSSDKIILLWDLFLSHKNVWTFDVKLIRPRIVFHINFLFLSTV